MCKCFVFGMKWKLKNWKNVVNNVLQLIFLELNDVWVNVFNGIKWQGKIEKK